MLNIAFNTLREIIRNKFLYLILVFAFLFIVFSISLWGLTLWDNEKIIIDFWLSMIEIFWIIWVLFVGSQLLFNEINGKTIFLILSKPIKRSEFILWKFFWFSAVLALIVLFQSLLFLAVLLFTWIELDRVILFSLLFVLFKLEIILSLVLFFSTFMSNMLSIIVSLLMFIIGSSFNLIIDLFIRAQDSVLLLFIKSAGVILPPIEALNVKDTIWTPLTFWYEYFALNSLYATVYIVIVMTFTIFLFNRKKFEG